MYKNVLLTLSSVGSGWIVREQGCHCHTVCPGEVNQLKGHLLSLDNHSQLKRIYEKRLILVKKGVSGVPYLRRDSLIAMTLYIHYDKIQQDDRTCGLRDGVDAVLICRIVVRVGG